MSGKTDHGARRQRQIQRRAERANKRQPHKKTKTAPQTGARNYPEPPFPKQHQSKPGQESELKPPPMYEAPFYVGSRKLEGKAALITGGDSGIGRAVAVLFAREGADVAISYLSEKQDAEITRQAVEAEGRRCILISGDVSLPHHCKRVVAAVCKAFGRLDVLVNNAAFQIHVSKIEDIQPKQLKETLATNLHGYFYMAQAAIPHLPPGSAIINTGSVTGILGNSELLDYSMTKGGIHAFTRSLAGHLISRGIRVNCVAPGPVWTPLNPADKQASDVSQFGAKTLMQRPAQPEEIAPAYVFLASSHCSSYITGEVLPIVGGYSGH